jgi:hypothetical protein
MLNLLFQMVIVIVVLIVILYVIEAIYVAIQKDKFIKNLKVGDTIKYKDQNFCIFEINSKTKTATIYNLFYNAFTVDLENIYPIKGFKSALFDLTKK